jgi:uncharacterized protein (TIGR00369 family)
MTAMSRITAEEIHDICDSALPWAVDMGMRVETIGEGVCRVRLPFRESFLRPGGTVSGPALMGLADFGMYVAVLSAIGRVELAVTTNLCINFLRKPGRADVLADCRLIKLGKRLAYGEVFLFSEGAPEDEPVAHVTATYSIPPER